MTPQTKIVIQCANTKDPSAGSMMMADGRKVVFVAQPSRAPEQPGVVFARPDDMTSDGDTWRDKLLAYNLASGDNPYQLLPAFRLYRNPAYAALAAHVGVRNLYILSAGWGLLAADFLTPEYDITFSSQPEPFKRRTSRDSFNDINMLADDSDAPVVFLGGKDYLPLFSRLTARYSGSRTAIYHSSRVPEGEGIQFVRYVTAARTNWHYEAANALLDGRFDLPDRFSQAAR